MAGPEDDKLVRVEVSPGVIVRMKAKHVPPERRLPDPPVKNTVLGINTDNPFGWNDPPVINPDAPRAAPTPRLGDDQRKPKPEPEAKKEEPKPAEPAKPEELATGGGGSSGGAAEPEPALDPDVAAAMNEVGGGGAPYRPGGIQVSTIEQKRTPGMNLIPELARRLGYAPSLGEEVDEEATAATEKAAPTTWGEPKQIMRKRESEGDKAARRAGEAAAAAEERRVADERQAHVNRMAGFNDEAKALDDEAKTIADRRSLLANMKAGAEQSANEARNVEPKTHEQVWQSKGGFARAMGVVAMAIGGYVQGLGRTGGRNPGADMINKVIDDAVAEEKDKAERADKKATGKQSDYERAFALYGDPEAAALQSKLRKIRNVQGLLDQRAGLKGLDEGAKARIAQAQDGAEMAYLNSMQELHDKVQGKVESETVNYKNMPATGGGGRAPTTLDRLKAGAAAAEAKRKMAGTDGAAAPRAVEGGTVDAINGALETMEAADNVQRHVESLGYKDSDTDDPNSGAWDKTVGKFPGTQARKTRQDLQSSTEDLARGVQKEMGKSDNDALKADDMSVRGGSGRERWKSAGEFRDKAAGRLQSYIAGMAPQQRETYINGLPPARRKRVLDAMKNSGAPARGKSEKAAQ